MTRDHEAKCSQERVKVGREEEEGKRSGGETMREYNGVKVLRIREGKGAEMIEERGVKKP